VALFIQDSSIRPGSAPGVEVSALYAFYRSWAASQSPPPQAVTPLRFARALRKLGFRRRKRQQRRGQDRRLLAMQPDVAKRMRDWLDEHPLTEQDRAFFDPRARRNTPKEP
jgi:hypothetical protein